MAVSRYETKTVLKFFFIIFRELEFHSSFVNESLASGIGAVSLRVGCSSWPNICLCREINATGICSKMLEGIVTNAVDARGL